MKCCRATINRKRHGFTLIEAVVGTVLLAAFATSTVLAFRGHQKQLRQAREQLAAVQAADDLMGQLVNTPAFGTEYAVGPIPSQPAWQWRVRPTSVRSVVHCEAQVALFEVIDLQTRRVLARVEFVARVVAPEKPA